MGTFILVFVFVFVFFVKEVKTENPKKTLGVQGWKLKTRNPYNFWRQVQDSSPEYIYTHTRSKTLHRLCYDSSCLPEQVKPSALSLNPLLQEHWKLPSVFVQVCWHPPLASEHSFLSVLKQENKSKLPEVHKLQVYISGNGPWDIYLRVG